MHTIFNSQWVVVTKTNFQQKILLVSISDLLLQIVKICQKAKYTMQLPFDTFIIEVRI